MIERQTIGGRDATVAYLTSGFEPTTTDAAQLVKVIFDDGETLFLRPEGPKPKGTQIMGHSLAAWAKSFADDDAHRIEAAIRNGLLSGMENTEVARRVVGSQRLAGVDGVTEITRRHIAALARVTLPKRKPKRA
jgi:hypothetical protein